MTTEEQASQEGAPQQEEVKSEELKEEIKEEVLVINEPEKVEDITESAHDFVLGIDFGSTKTVVSIAKFNEFKHLPFVLHNTIGELLHENIISYSSAERVFGVNASSQLIVNPQFTVYNIKQYLGKTTNNFDSQLRDDTRFNYSILENSEKLGVSIPSSLLQENVSEEAASDQLLSFEQIAASLLKRYSSYAESDSLYWQFRKKILDRLRRLKQIAIKDQSVNGLAVNKCVLTVPNDFDLVQRAALADAAKIAGLEVLHVIDDATATALAYSLLNNSNYKAENENEAEKQEFVVILDVGRTNLHASISNVKFNSLDILHTQVSQLGVGAHFESLLYRYAETEIRKKYAKHFAAEENARLSNRSKAKLYRAVQKAITVLSTIPQTVIEVDSLLPELNVQLEITRALFETISAPAISAVESFLETLISHENVNLDASNLRVEVLGGSSRIPAIQERIKRAFRGRELCKSLDSNASTSTGAAIFGALFSEHASKGEKPEEQNNYLFKNYEQVLAQSRNSLEENQHCSSSQNLVEFAEVESKLCERDEREKKFKDLKNSYEQTIYSLRDQCNQALQNQKISKSDEEKCLKLMGEEEEWLLYSSPSENTAFDELNNRLQAFKDQLSTTSPSFSEYLQFLEEERIRKEKEAAEQEANREVHYRDKVSNPITPKERLDAALKRKDQGNELFKDINYEHAIQRYKQALGLVAEIPGDKFEQEIQQTKLTCYLNLAMCYLNLKKYSFAADNCESALSIDAKNVKALFRLGKANYMQKKYDEAKKNFGDLLAVEPQNKDAAKQLALVEKAIRVQQENEQKMYAKMFA